MSACHFAPRLAVLGARATAPSARLGREPISGLFSDQRKNVPSWAKSGLRSNPPLCPRSAQLPTSPCRRGAGQGYERPGDHRHQGRRRRGRPAGCQAPGPGKSRGCAVFEKASAGTPKLAARISGGVWATQSVRSSVLNSLALPSSKQMMNSHPSDPSPCNECGRRTKRQHESTG